MSINGRNKGKAGEREFFNLMNKLLGYEAFNRNLSQTRGGGEDGETDFPVAVEVKRQEKLSFPAAIKQAKEQGTKSGKLPVLAHRRNREDWNVMVVLTAAQAAVFFDYLDDRKELAQELLNANMRCVRRQRSDEEKSD